jgi:hypothetical protein
MRVLAQSALNLEFVAVLSGLLMSGPVAKFIVLIRERLQILYPVEQRVVGQSTPIDATFPKGVGACRGVMLDS